ncbi:MAG: hypothetical protein OXH22_11420 [Chloroflexi bacterium]|nr:hypothetical protein [Chloroflexota bacterium]
MLTIPIIVLGVIVGATGIAFVVWSTIDTRRKYGSGGRNRSASE